MKQPKSKIWQKKRQKKFKKAKQPVLQTSQANIQGIQSKQPEPVKKAPPQKNLSLLGWFAKKKQAISYKKETKNHKATNNRFKIWLQQYDSDLQLILFPLILLVVLLILYVFNNQLFLTISHQDPVVADQTPLNPYPYVQAASTPTITAKAAIIVDRGSQVILFSKNPQLRFSIASTTKIMTATVALSHFKPNDIITVKRSSVPGSGLNLYLGEQFKFSDIMYAMLLPSANDAAQAIADNYPGGNNAFIQQMNDKAQSLHLSNTHYADPTGLDDDGDYSTVVDMARLASYAISNPTFAKVTSTKYKTIYTSNFSKQYPLTTTNELLGIDGVTGIKTGTTEGAGEVLVTSVVRNGHTYIIIVMDSQDRFADTSTLLHFLDTSVKYIIPQGSSM